MTTYDLYLESGPRHRTTMVHVLDLLGCVAVGPTTEDAIAATPEAIRAYRRLLRRVGEAVDPDAPFETKVAEHIIEGQWLGNGSPYLVFASDFAPLADEDVAVFLRRIDRLCGELADWVSRQTTEHLDAKPARGRTARAILLHVLGAQGGALSAALGSAPGFGKIHGAVERGELDLAVGLRRSADLVAERVYATTPEQRNAVRELSSRSYTLRKAFRRMMEHQWEHLVELSRRPGGPAL
jgi:hypothetical protein